ncbi:hypothetical protein LMG27174_04759 [Paraburkholderia rhynchosiae]|uniref:Uncharacterized protein n=1 Tax=Paraburkholderia rhynchosiae TaxID=487049 RepID=A0A2N7W8X8_9BURK|nr:hypothetical protein C0Z16_28485 [Paraburkholderia rhynchosiae]CAB3718577.1 hypothetical protein LMG27174_04759 [Paraburkholderia rhynchosiae]
MKSDLHEPSGPALGDASRTLDPGSGQMRGQAQSRALEGLGYPFRATVTLMAALALAVICLVLPVPQGGLLGRVGQGLEWTLTVPIVLSWLVLIWLRTRQLSRARTERTRPDCAWRRDALAQTVLCAHKKKASRFRDALKSSSHSEGRART